MNKFVTAIVMICTALAFPIFGQLAQGPAQGMVPSGIIVSTNNFAKMLTITEPQKPVVHNKEVYVEKPVNFDLNLKSAVKQVYKEDLSVIDKSIKDTAAFLIKNFEGNTQTNSIPPDPYVAVGPNHIISVVNTVFSIWDKNGALLKTISGDAFFTPILSGVSTFDPKVLYDHFNNRWIMVWLHANTTTKKAFFLLAVSANENPLGNWSTWALPSNVNGSTPVDQWGDYQGVGFDDSCIYITSNQFSNANSFQYAKIRVIPTAQLYDNLAGRVLWNDFWNITTPSYGGSVFCVRPAVMREHSDAYYLAYIPNYSANFVAVYKITNPATNPVLTGNVVGTNNYSPASNANQLGGGSMLIEGGGGQLRNEPKVMNNKMYLSHSVRNPYSTANSALRYLQIDLTNNTALQDQLLGANGFWHFYSAIDVDKYENVAITYSRSGLTEYAGAYFTYQYKNDASLRNSSVLQVGKGNYVKDYGSGRNRWGDYNGIQTDPSDSVSFWMFGEYVSATNTWSTRAGQVRLTTFPGDNLSASSLNFSNIEINTVSDTLSSFIVNRGSNDLIISAAPDSVGPFKIVSQISLPYTVHPYDTLAVNIVFRPTITKTYDTTYALTSNVPSFSGINVKAKSYVIKPVLNNTVYGSTGAGDQAKIFTLNTTTGVGTLLGSSLQNDIKSLAVNPKTKIMYGLVGNTVSTSLYRVNSEIGDAYFLKNIPLANAAGICFDTNGVCLLALKTGDFYQIDLATGDTTKLSSSHINISSFTVNSLNNQVWAAFSAAIGTNKDKLYKVNPYTGDTVFVGKTGFGILTNALVFDKLGNLYGVTGAPSAVNNMIKIDTLTGAGTLVGSTTFKNITGLSAYYDKATSVENSTNKEVPNEFTIQQNYPNPFNPSTTIEYSLPVNSNVKIIVYNLLGEVVSNLLNAEMSAGVHKITWDASSYTSGTYFYEIRANGSNGKSYSQIKKMVFMK